MSKLTLLAAAGVGYVLGARAGRERYEQIRAQAQKVRNDPRVQRRADEAKQTVREQAPVVKDKAAGAAAAAAGKANDAASSAKHKVGSDSSSSSSSSGTTTGPSGSPITNSPQA